MATRQMHFLDSLLHARSVAVVGASDVPAKWGARVLGYLLQYGFQGTIYPLNPKSEHLFGLRCYPDIRSLPEPPDVVVIAIPKQFISDPILQCCERGVKFAVIITSGFAEIGEAGRSGQEELKRLIQGSGLRIVGPNVIGIISAVNKMPLAATAALEAGVLLQGNIGLLSQSGAMAGSFLNRAQDRNLGLRYMINTGNEVDLEISDFIEYLVDDPGTNVIACFIEGVRNPRRFLDVTEKAMEAGKPIIVLKIGDSERGSRAARSHTASLSGSAAIYNALFRQKGIVRVDTFDGLLETLMLFSKGRFPTGDGLGVVSASGGACGFVSDRCAAVGLDLPDLSPQTATDLAGAMGLETVQNPIDLGSQQTGNQDMMGKILQAFDGDPKIASILTALATAPGLLESFGRDVATYARTGRKPIIVLPLAGSVVQPAIRHVAEENVPVLLGTDESLKAIREWFWYTKFKSSADARLATREYASPANLEAIRASLMNQRGLLTEPEAKRILAGYGIPVTVEAMAARPVEAATIAHRIGFPVALKVVSREITHKTEVGGIKLNLTSEADVLSAFDELIASAKAHRPDVHIEGVLVQEMVLDGLETIVGMSKDPDFGPAIVFGLGGIFVELLRDISVRLAPLNAWDANEMLREIKSYPILEGARGQVARDVRAVEDILLKLSRLACDLGDLIDEIDLNPLMLLADGAGAKVVDAVMILKT